MHGTAAALVALAMLTPYPALAVGIVPLVLASVVSLRRAARTSRRAALLIEQRYPSLKNLAVTAEELIADPERTRPYMRERVMRDAAASMSGIDAGRVVPLTRDALAVGGAVLALLVVPYARVRLPAASPAASSSSTTASVAGDVLVTVTPPAYTKRPASELRNPAAIDALSGSVATIRVHGVPDAVVRVNGAGVPADTTGTVRTTLTESGYVAVDAGALHRLLPLTVTPDARPEVRVTAPGKDLRVATANEAIPIQVTAADDIELRSLSVRYTVVSGGGEQFTFSEGVLPADFVRSSERAWSAGASLSLKALKLEPGDALIYRAVASDARPGAAGEASSDTYFVEVAGPGDVALEGVEMPPDRERYALSQAMIVLKLQRLIARQAAMRRPEMEEAAAGIAAEQRAVKANFIFLLGGEIEDEVVEAEESHEIQEGRLANQSRREIVAATLLMTKVERALAAVSPRTALPPAQDAVRALQRAFGHSRYLLRALPARVRLDPARRLSGDLAAVRDWARELGGLPADPRTAAARLAAMETTDVSRDPAAPGVASRLAALAERVLAIEPGAADLRSASRSLLEARDAFARGDAEKGRAALQAAAAPLVARAQRGRTDVPFVSPDAARLAGAAAGGPR
jgi:hypothetical protein